MNLTNINRVKIMDYKDYDPNLCNNGGKYGFTNEYYRIDDNNFECHYFTTADFNFCEITGRFQECHTCPSVDYIINGCNEEFNVVSEEELIDILKVVENEQDENYHYILE